MHSKRFKRFMSVFLIMSAVLLIGIFFDNKKQKNDDMQAIQITESDSFNESSSDKFFAKKTTQDEFNFYISSNSLKKSIVTFGETTMFILETKLFVSNENYDKQNFYKESINAAYDINGKGLFFEFDIDLENPNIEVSGGETISFNVVLKYVITDVENFNIYYKSELKFSYKGQSVLIENV